MTLATDKYREYLIPRFSGDDTNLPLGLGTFSNLEALRTSLLP